MTNSEQEPLEILKTCGAFRSGHFVYTSGRHGDTYINKDRLFLFPKETSSLCRMLAEQHRESGAEVVIGPAVAAAIIAQLTAYHLTEMVGRNVFAAYADKDGGDFALKRGYDAIVTGRKVLVVEDLVTTGGSIRKVIEAARRAGGDIVGAAVLCNRGAVEKDAIGNPIRFTSVARVALQSWEAADCPLCKKGVPVDLEVGHGRRFMEQKRSGGFIARVMGRSSRNS
jgi:orotate phosphoribosyltransferase